MQLTSSFSSDTHFNVLLGTSGAPEGDSDRCRFVAECDDSGKLDELGIEHNRFCGRSTEGCSSTSSDTTSFVLFVVWVDDGVDV